jgi:uncharacterized protein (DUF1015 family)
VSTSATGARQGLSLAPFSALRPTAPAERLGRLLCPPYDVIDPGMRAELLATDPDNAVAVILPEPTPPGYAAAAERLAAWVASGRYALDSEPALYVYEMRTPDGRATRGLLGAVELRDPDDGVILPHENTMAGPVADRLEVMTATGTDLEPIYLVYDGGGPASAVVQGADRSAPVAEASMPDGTVHRLWTVTDPAVHAAIATDLATRRALIADGHHRYATYRERQRRLRSQHGAGPWDRGLALLVDSSEYGPQVHAIHRVIRELPLAEARDRLGERAALTEAPADPQQALAEAADVAGFAVVLTDGRTSYLLTDPDGTLASAVLRPGEPAALAELDVSVLHRGLVEDVWGLPDTEDVVGYAHSAAEAIQAAQAANGVAVLVRPTPVEAVAAVAAAGARMPRKSTLFTPKPASGLVMRRLADQHDLSTG